MLERLRILPLLVFVAMLAFSVRLADVVLTGVPSLSGAAHAEDAKVPSQEDLKPPAEDKTAENKANIAEKPPEEKAVAEKPAEEKKGGLVIEDDVNDKKPSDKKEEHAATDEEKDKQALDKEAGAVPLSEWKDAGDSDLDVGDVRIEMFADLSKRRDELDKREASIVTKEALLKAAEQELDRKYQELDRLREEIKTLLGQQEEQESARILSLVKVYEGMKPTDAARIFDTLDMDILLAVMSKMSERKLSPVLAAMNAERAKTVTTLLAEQKQLPEVPSN